MLILFVSLLFQSDVFPSADDKVNVLDDILVYLIYLHRAKHPVLFKTTVP